jgi:hypothetical protein
MNARSSIYRHVRDQLRVHSGNDPKALGNKRLLVLFVQLERARRLVGFAEVARAVEQIERHLIDIGERYRVIYAYMYLYFGEAEPLEREHGPASEGRFSLTYKDEYRFKTERILTHIWAGAMFDRYRDHFLAACYRDR